jgi:hypothetical protein
MQSGSSQRAATAWPAGVVRRLARACALLSAPLLGLTLSACAGSGQIANLAPDTPRAAVAFESIDGPPPAVVKKFVQTLKDEAGARQIGVVAPGQANYRLRGYLAAHNADAGAVITWALDVYDGGQHRAFRLTGEERSEGRAWAGANDQVLQQIARTGMSQLAAFLSSNRTAAATPPQPRQRSAALGWLDDWAPEASGIFRILRSAPARQPEMTADAGTPSAAVPLPRGRPTPDGPAPAPAVALASADLDR